MFRSIRSLFGISGKKPVQQPKRFKNVRMKFDTLEERYAPAIGVANFDTFNISPGGNFLFQISNAGAPQAGVLPSSPQTGSPGGQVSAGRGWSEVNLQPSIFTPGTPAQLIFDANAQTNKYTVAISSRTDDGVGNSTGDMSNFNTAQNYEWLWVKGANPTATIVPNVAAFSPSLFFVDASGVSNKINGADIPNSSFSVAFRDTDANSVPDSLFVVYTAPVAANAPPSRTAPAALPTISVAEDSANTTAVTLGLAAAAYSPGPAAESGQVLTYAITSIPSYVALFQSNGTTPVTVGTLGSGAAGLAALQGLTYKTLADQNGTGNLTFTVKDNGGGPTDTLTENLAIAVTAVNDVPVRTAPASLPTISVSEDSANTTAVTLGLGTAAYTPGPANESGQVLTYAITAIPSSISLFASNGTTPVTVGTLGTGAAGLAALQGLTYKTLANQSGTGNLTFTVKDDGGTVNGGVDTLTENVSITVASANDAPSFTKGPDQTVFQTAGAQTVNSWATNISAGPANESGQTVTFITTVTTGAALFSVAPAISSNGTLTYTPLATASGVATISVVAMDNGGTANGGVDTSAAQTFTITVTSPAGPLVTTTNLSSGTNPSTYGNQVTYTVTVSATGPTPTGTVNLLDGANQIGTTTLSNGSATFQISTLTAGTHSLTAQYVGATGFNPSTSTIVSQVVNKKTLTAAGFTAAGKVYDAKTTATISGTGTLSGVLAGDTVSLTGTATGTFDSKNVGARTATISGLSLTGASANNYQLGTVTAAGATITPKTVTISGLTAQNKVYDATTAATLAVVSGGKTAIVGIIGGDRVNYNIKNAVGTFADANVGNGKTVTITFAANTLSSPTSGNNDAGNYIVAPATTTANITAAPLTITANSISRPVGQVVTFNGTEFTSTGLVGGQTIGSATITSTGSGAAATAGTYAIVISNATGGTFNLSNYNPLYVNGVLTRT
jgi:hypothetical protein